MIVIEARNVNDAYLQGHSLLMEMGQLRESRAGDVTEIPCPVTTHYRNPRERVLFDAGRDANPFFHFMEGLYLLAGRKDLAWIAQFNKKMADFSDNGETLEGSYGARWRYRWFDQLRSAATILRENPDDRRVVVSMWDPIELQSHKAGAQIGKLAKDLPCNTHIYFKIRNLGMGPELLMTVCNRSNDMLWGAYGANVVHMSMLHEYMAAKINVAVGSYWQVSDSFHVYNDVWMNTTISESRIRDGWVCPYTTGEVDPYPMVKDAETWDWELFRFTDFIAPNNDDPESSTERYHPYKNPFFSEVAMPMYFAWRYHQKRDYHIANSYAETIMAGDWKDACLSWLERREEGWRKRNAAADE